MKIGLNAYAKINWDLHILGRRPDGFHALDTVMVNVSLHDEIVLETDANLTLTCSDPALPVDESNLVMKAARALAAASGYSGGARIHLTKHIPAGGGMGGGSSDAACTLAGLNKLWNLNWPVERLHPIAAQLGSDVSFFLYGGWRRCLGRGEIVEPLSGSEHWPKIPLLLILPAFSIPTPPVYKALHAPPFDEKNGARCLTDVRDALTSVVETLRNRAHQVDLGLFNSLTEAAQRVEPELKALQQVLQRLCPRRWLMSGSGSVHFVVLNLQPSEETAVIQEALIREAGSRFRVLTATTFSPLI